MARIDRLTPEQEDLIPVVRDEWLADGLSTVPANREEAEKGVDIAYREAGLSPPSIKIWMRSPLEGSCAAAMLSASGSDTVRAQVWNQVGAQVRDQVGAQVWDQVWDQVRAQVGAQVWAQVRDQVFAVICGQHDAGWCSWADFWSRIGFTDKAQGLLAVARNSGWWWAFSGVAILTERPASLSRDDRNRLHNDSGPSVLYTDEFAVWAWHGVRVPRHVIEKPDAITLDEIAAEENAEVRRVMRERFGEGRYLMATGATVLDTDYEGARKGAAPRALLVDSEGQKTMVGTDGSTGRVYYMRVPSNVKTCSQAHVALCGFDETLILNKS